MTDRELLELAAKAAGLVLQPKGRTDGAFLVLTNEDGDYIWDPLTDDGDALRLAVKLRMEIDILDSGIAVRTQRGHKVLSTAKDWNADSGAATRRAIVRAAAEIGKALP